MKSLKTYINESFLEITIGLFAIICYILGETKILDNLSFKNIRRKFKSFNIKKDLEDNGYDKYVSNIIEDRLKRMNEILSEYESDLKDPQKCPVCCELMKYKDNKISPKDFIELNGAIWDELKAIMDNFDYNMFNKYSDDIKSYIK